MNHQPKRIYEFGPFRLDATERLLLRDGAVVPLTPKVFDLLLALVEHHGHLLEKDELMKLVWPDAVVEEANLANNISILRKTLGENGQQFIETAPKRGYRFVALVRELEKPVATVAMPQSPPAAWGASRRIKWMERQPTLIISLAILLLIGAAGAISFWSAKRQAVAPNAAIKSIAVLPFKPLVTGERDEAMELGMADTLITKLSGLRQLIVRPTSAVRRYTALDQDPLAAGREQRVEAVLEASYQWTGEKIRVTVRLLQVSDGAPLWAYQCNAYCDDIFTAQDIISEKVAQSLTLGLTAEERRHLAKHHTDNKDAYLLYQKGRFIQSKRTLEAYEKSVEYFSQAIEKDPNFALAYVGLADAYFAPAYGAAPLQDSVLKRDAALKKALELDETLAEAHVTIANILFGEWDLTGSNREYQRAFELNPNYAPAHQGYGRRNLLLMGQLDEAIAHLKRAQELDPLSLIINSDIGTFYFYTGQYDKAIEQLQKTLEMDQNFYPAHRYLGRAFEMKGSLQEALAEYQKAWQLNGDPLLLAHIGRVYAVSGKNAEASKTLNQLKEISSQRYVSAYSYAVFYSGFGERDRIFQWLERAYQERSINLSHLTVEPYFANLRSDPRFADLVRRIGFQPQPN